jgi:hypothetical protein
MLPNTAAGRAPLVFVYVARSELTDGEDLNGAYAIEKGTRRGGGVKL